MTEFVALVNIFCKFAIVWSVFDVVAIFEERSESVSAVCPIYKALCLEY